MALTAKMRINMNINYTGSGTLQDPSQPIDENRGITLTNGTGVNKGNRCYAETITIGDGANATLDVQALTDTFGDALDFDIIRAMYIYNSSADATLIIGGAAGTQLDIFGDQASDKLHIPPGCEFMMTWPTAAGLDVTTNKDLKYEHDGTGGDSMDFDIIIVGED